MDSRENLQKALAEARTDDLLGRIFNATFDLGVERNLKSSLKWDYPTTSKEEWVQSIVEVVDRLCDALDVDISQCIDVLTARRDG